MKHISSYFIRGFSKKTQISFRYIFVFLLLTGLSTTAAAQSFEFDNCGVEGKFGPSSGDCDYDDFDVDVDEGFQILEIPEDGVYNITAAGAGIGVYSSQKGAVIGAELELEEGDRLRIGVGQLGYDRHVGQGGTMVAKEVEEGDTMFDGQDVKPLVMAGGAGGANTDRSEIQGAMRTFAKEGASGSRGEDGQGGGDEDVGGSCFGGAGGGFLTDGAGCPGGMNWLDGAVGGEGDDGDNTDSQEGGFGASGGHSNSGSRRGGGGGYSGGGAGGSSSYAGGGGSFIHAEASEPATSDGTWETTGSEPHNVYEGEVGNLERWHEGNGEVIIEKIETDFCNFRGPFNECIMNETNSLQEQEYEVSSVFESRNEAVFEAFNGPAVIDIQNTTKISGTWRGEIAIQTDSPRIEAGAEFNPENERIQIGN